jgi:hypothetical protein
MDLGELLQLEKNVEDAFCAAFVGAAPNIYPAQSVETAQSPRIEVHAVIGAVHGQRITLSSGREMFNTWFAELQTTIVTNRTIENRNETHNRLIGEVRARCQRFAILPNWEKYTDAILLMDIREDGAEDSVVDTDNLDKTQINWAILFSLNPTAIPTNI